MNDTDAVREALKPAEGVSMRAHELEASATLLRQHIQAHPAIAPWYIRAQDIFALDGSGLRTAHLQPAFAVVLMVLFVGAGTSYAAENALPGDVLYPVKTVVNEGVRSAIAVSPAAQVQWQTERVNRRLAEVQTLAEKDALTPDITAAIEHDVNDAADVIDAHSTFAAAPAKAAIQALSEVAPAALRGSAHDEANDSGSDSIRRHVRSLDAAIAGDKSTTTREEMAAIVAHVRGRFHTEDDAVISATNVASPDVASSPETMRAAALRQRETPEGGRRGKLGNDSTAAIAPSVATTTPASVVPSIHIREHGDDEEKDD